MLKWQVIAAAAAVLLIGLIAIDAAQRDTKQRILWYEKGTYLGQPDTPVGEETVEQLRRRGRTEAVGW